MTDTTTPAPTTPVVAAKPEIKPTVRQTHSGRFQLAEHIIQGWAVMVEDKTTIEDVLKPEFFAHVARALRPFAKISVLADDGTWYAELLVKSAGSNWANVVPLQIVDLRGVAAAVVPADAYAVGFGGPHHKWRVIRNSDSELVSKGHESEALAKAWLVDHLKALAR